MFRKKRLFYNAYYTVYYILLLRQYISIKSILKLKTKIIKLFFFKQYLQAPIGTYIVYIVLYYAHIAFVRLWLLVTYYILYVKQGRPYRLIVRRRVLTQSNFNHYYLIFHRQNLLIFKIDCRQGVTSPQPIGNWDALDVNVMQR